MSVDYLITGVSTGVIPPEMIGNQAGEWCETKEEALKELNECKKRRIKSL